MGLAHHIASRYPALDHDDAVQEALIALWKASPRYDPARGSEVAFARRVIENRFRTLAGTAPSLGGQMCEVIWYDVDHHKHDDLDAAVARLPLSWQHDLDLVYGLRGPAFPITVVAALQGTTKKAVSERLRKARNLLREYL